MRLFKVLVVVLVLLLFPMFFLMPQGVNRTYAQSVCGPTDVVFSVDATGSMGGAIDNVKDGLIGITDQVLDISGGDYQLGLVSFFDNVVVNVDLAPGNIDPIKTAVNGLSASGGSMWAEASDESLNTIINGLDAADRAPGQQTGDFNGTFRSGANKVIILITDAPPGGFDDICTVGEDDVNAHNLAEQALAQGIHINSVYVSFAASASSSQTPPENLVAACDPETVLRDYASTTGGKFVQASGDGSGTAAAIGDILATCGVDAPTQAIPEPMTMLLFGGGVAALGAYVSRRRKQNETA